METPCVLTDWPKGSKGYGLKKGKLAHRVAWEEANGPIPAGMFVCHRCDNPPCCNVDHLFLGTPADNSADCKSKGRTYKPKGEMNHRCRLTAAQVTDIRSRPVKNGLRADLAEEFKVSAEYIKDLRKTKLKKWKHLPMP